MLQVGCNPSLKQFLKWTHIALAPGARIGAPKSITVVTKCYESFLPAMLICDKGVWGRGNPKIIQHVVNLAAFPGDDPNFGDVLVLPETSH